MAATEHASRGRSNPAAVVVCRCEEVLSDEIVAAIAAGAGGVDDVKRRTRSGMGFCQGIFCMPYIAAMVARETGTALERIAPMTARAPVRPIRLDALAEIGGIEADGAGSTVNEEK